MNAIFIELYILTKTQSHWIVFTKFKSTLIFLYHSQNVFRFINKHKLSFKDSLAHVIVWIWNVLEDLIASWGPFLGGG